MPKNEEKQASENDDGRMPAADAQQRMIGWAERVLQTFTPQDAMTVEQFADTINAQPPMRYSVTEYHEKIDVTEDAKKLAKYSGNAKLFLDPVSNQIEFGGLDEGGERYINTAPRGMPATNVYAAISFDEIADDIPALKELNAFDESVLENVFTLILENTADNGKLPLVSISQICLAMTNGRTDGGKLYAQVKASVEKMGVTRITIDNTEEIDEGADYPYIKARGRYLLPFEWYAIEYRGREEYVMQFLRVPALLAFAAGRNQIATISRELATCPRSQTKKRRKVYRYLLQIITKNNSPNVIYFDTICERCKITGAKERQRLPADLKEFFEYFKHCEAIESYHFLRKNKQLEKVTFTRVKKGAKKLENKH